MQTKMHRYMQRIEKIITTPIKNVSPIRPTKSPLRCRANQLDQYLKYELSAKIIQSVIKRHHDQLVNLFFNMIHRSQPRQKERIFKFVAIEKKDVKIDLGIAAKILVSVVKQIYKNRYSTFIQNIQILYSQEHSSFSKKKEETMKSAVLLRTSSRPQKQYYKEISEFNYDGSSSVGKEPSFKKYEQFKAYICKTILKLIIGKIKRLKLKGFIKIQQQGLTFWQKRKLQVKSEVMQLKSQHIELYQEKEPSIIKQIENLRIVLRKEKEENQYLKNRQENSKKQEKILFLQTIQQIFSHHFQLHKSKVLSGINLLARHQEIYSKQTGEQAKLLRKGKSLRQMSFIGQNILRRAFSSLKHSYFQKREIIIKRKEGILRLCLVFTKKLGNIFSLVVRNLESQVKIRAQRSQIISQYHRKQLNSRSVPDLMDFQSQRKHLFEPQETHNPLIKLNFYSFMDKIFKLILIISKMLIPLKEAFVKIDLYASYSYRIEECFKCLYQPRLRQALEALKSQKTLQPRFSEAELKIATVLERVLRQKYIEVFSFLKILSKEKDLKIKIFPVRQSIVDSTKYFLEERNIYSLYSMDYWDKVRQNEFQELGNPQKEYFTKKRSNTTF